MCFSFFIEQKILKTQALVRVIGKIGDVVLVDVHAAWTRSTAIDPRFTRDILVDSGFFCIVESEIFQYAKHLDKRHLLL